MPSPRQQQGTKGEEAALALLAQYGQRLLVRNHRCRRGELDLVTLDGDVLVFVEVRSRADGVHGDAAASVTPRKQRRVIHAARDFLMRYPEYQSRYCRFDVVTIDGDGPPQWIKNAFEVPSP